MTHISTTSKKKHKWEYDYDQLGFNYRLPNLNCALGLSQIKKISSYLKIKRNLFKNYQKLIDKLKINEFKLVMEPNNCKVITASNDIVKKPSYSNRNDILKFLMKMAYWQDLYGN